MSTVRLSTGIPDLDDLLGGVQSGDTLVFHAARVELYRPFAKAVSAWCRQHNRRLICIRTDDRLNDIFDEWPEEDVFNLTARRPSMEQFLNEFETYAQQRSGAFFICDNLTALHALLGDETDFRRCFQRMCAALTRLEAVSYWLLLKGAHPPETVAVVRHMARVFIDLIESDGETLLWPLKLSGRYSSRMLMPHRIVEDSGMLRLSLSHKERTPFTTLLQEKGAELAETLEHLAATQDELTHQTRMLSALLKTLQTVSTTLGQVLDEETLLTETLRLCDEQLELGCGWVYRLDSEDRFSLVAAHGLPPALEADDRAALRWTPCRCQRMLLDGELTEAINIVECERLERAQGDKRGYQYHASIPIRTGERIWGLLNLAYRPGRQLGPEELRSLTSLGSLLGAALERAHAYRRTQQQATELAARQRVTQSILQAVDLEDRLGIALREILALIDERSRRGIERQAAGEPKAESATVRGAIYLVEGDRLVLRIQEGFSENFLALARDLPLEACSWVHTTTTAHVPWEGSDPITQALRREAVTDWISLPLTVEERLEGIILLADRRAVTLDPDALRAMKALANQVAVVLHNARLYAQSQERLARLTTLREIDRAIAAQLSLEEVISVLLERVHPHVRADAVGLSLIDWERRRTTLTRLHLPEGVSIEGEAFALSDSLLEWLAVRRQPVLIYDLLADPRVRGHREIIRRHNLKSYLGVPLVVRDQAIGVLHVFTVEPHVFTSEEIDFFTTLAGQAAISIQNARMYEAAVRRGEALEALAQSTLSLAQAKPDLQVIRRLLENLCRTIRAPWGIWLTYSPHQRRLEPEALIGFSPETHPLLRSRLRMHLSDPWAPAVSATEGRAVYLRQVQGSPLWMEFDPRFRCAYCTPLTYSSRLYGVFVLLADKEDAFDAEQRSLADMFATYAATGLDNARLLQEIRHQAIQMEALNAIIAAAVTAQDLPHLLKTALDHTLQALDLDMGAIWIGNESVIQGLPQEMGRLSAQLARSAGLDVAQPIVVENWSEMGAEDSLSAMAEVMGRYGIRASITVPILVENQRIGGLSVAAPEPRRWHSEETTLVEAVGRELGNAVERTRLFAKTREHATLMARLQGITEAMTQLHSVSEVVEIIGRGAMRLIGADRAAVYIRHSDDSVSCAWSHGLSPEYVKHAIARTRQMPGRRFLESAPSNAGPGPILISDIEQLPAESPVYKLASSEGYRAVSLWPLVYERRVIAAVTCYYDAPRTWSEVEREVMNAFCRQAAVAMENARLFQETQQAYEELRRTQQQLLQAQKMEAIGQLAAGVAHDFNNQLTAIQGYAELMLLAVPEDSPLRRYIHQLCQATSRAASLTRQLLLFSRREPMNMVPVDLNYQIRELQKMLGRLIGEDIEIELALADDLWTVKADPGNIDQVITNLVVNARDAMPRGGLLRIGTENVIIDEAYCRHNPEARSGQYVCLTVADTGVGMDQRTMARIFEPFFTTKEVGKGTGLGLSVVYGIVKAHDGWITVESQPGQGSQFRVYLPAVTHEAKIEAAEERISIPDHYRGHGERILLVEDASDVREITESILRESNYTVYACGTVAEAIEIFQRERPDLVLSDVVLPDGRGVDLVCHLKEREPALSVMLMSGYTDDRSEWERIRERKLPFLRKPYKIGDLLKIIHDVLTPKAHPETSGGDSRQEQ